MPIEDLILERLSALYPSDRPKLWETNMKAAILEYRRMLLENLPDEDFKSDICKRETIAILIGNAESN